MLLKTILNRLQKHSGFVYEKDRLVEEGEQPPRVEVEVRPRAGSRARCSNCGRPGPGYDTLPQRRFEFVPLWGLKVFLLYAPRRVAWAKASATASCTAAPTTRRPSSWMRPRSSSAIVCS